MNFFKRFQSVLLVFCVSLLAACGGGDSGGSGWGGNSHVNIFPVADAGEGQAVAELAPVTISGTGSDSDGYIVSYRWTQVDGASVMINNPDQSSAEFTAPQVTGTERLTFMLTVTDNNGATSSDTVTVTVTDSINDDSSGDTGGNADDGNNSDGGNSGDANNGDDDGTTDNQLPVAYAGSDLEILERGIGALNGRGVDSDGTVVQYQWEQVSGTSVAIINPSNAVTEFSAPSVTSSETLTFRLTVTDNDGATASDTITITILDRVERAAATGDPSYLTDSEEVLDATINKLNTIRKGNGEHLRAIYGDGRIEYDPGQSSQFIAKKDYDRFIPLLYGNKGKVLAAAGVEGSTRYAAFGSNPVSFFQAGNNLAYENQFKRLLAWLLSMDPDTVSDLNMPLNVGLSLFTNSEKSKVTGWLQTQFPAWVITSCDDEVSLSDSYGAQDLLILASNGSKDADTVTRALENAVNKGVPVLFIRQTTWGTYTMDNVVLSVINLAIGSYGGNWWSKDKAAWGSVEDMLTLDSGLNSVETMLQHFKADDYDFDWSYCTSYVGSVSCGDVPGLKDEFEDGASNVRSLLGALDKTGFRLFEEDGYGLAKHLVLLGDIYRKGIQYPMDKETTDSNVFFQAYYSDHAVYYNRSINPEQPDLGTFSNDLPGDVPVVSRSVVIDAKPQGGFTATGLYALPGQTVTIRRTDSGSDTVKMFINSMRTGSSRVYNRNLYNRPKFLRSHSVSLPENGDISLTTPYGGPIFIEPSKNHSVELEISDAGQHAVLLDMGDVDTYAAELENSPYTWTQIVTPFVEIHSRTDKMLSSINNEPYNGDAGALIDDIWTYLIKDSYELAGFVGEGLTRSASVTDFCSTMGWDCDDSNIHKAPKTQHINIDLYANCGGGCSGNPYDQTWAISPKGWGESHEIGHNLQRGRLKIYGGQSGEVSNQIFPLHKYYSYNRDYGYEFGAKSYYEKMFITLQDAVNSNDPFTVAYDAVWAETGYAKQNRQRMTFYMQIVHQGETLAFLDNGWELLTLMYMQDRLFGNVSDWATEKDDLGFSTYESKPSIDGNDFMLISMSWITGKDQRSFFDMWGVSYSDEAANQVAAFGFESAGRYFYIPEDAVDYKPVAHVVPVDGIQVWPL